MQKKIRKNNKKGINWERILLIISLFVNWCFICYLLAVTGISKKIICYVITTI